jgi:hypothetical protein
MALLLALALVTAAPPPSTNPYVASMRYAECLRAHGVPHPNPDRSGNFSLTPAQEQRLRAVGHDKVLAADKACFHHLKGLNNRPLTPQAKRRALGVLRELSRCIAGYGFQMGKPVVENKPRGRAFFGFETGPPMSKALAKAQHTCEQRVDLAGKIDRIVAEDRSGL